MTTFFEILTTKDLEFHETDVPEPATSLLYVIDEPEFFDDGMTADPCPACGAPKRWRHAITRFLACSTFPKCRWTSYKRSQP